MQVKAQLKNARVSPRKARLVADFVRGMDATEAQQQLKFMSKKAAPLFQGLIKSAVANAENNNGLNGRDLFISEVFVNEGRVLKRWQPRAFGRAYPILKKSSHLVVILDQKEKEEKKADKKTEKKDAKKPAAKKESKKKEEAAKPVKKEAKKAEKKEEKQSEKKESKKNK